MEHAYDSDDFVLCKNLAKQVLEFAPTNINALRGLGLSCFMLQEYENALDSFARALEFSEEKEFEYTYIAWSYCNLNNHIKACEMFEKAIEINPLYEPALSGRTQAIIHLHGDRLDKIEQLEKKIM